MRNPWHYLTMRGKIFLFVGFSVLGAAMLLGQRDVVWFGWLLILLPLVAMIFIARTKLRLTCERGFDRAQMEVDQSLEAKLSLEKTGNLPVGMLLFEEHVPPVLGRRPRFTVNNPTGTWTREVSYPINGIQRGRYTVGPLLVRSTDAFGLVKFDRQFNATSEVMVTPKVTPLSTMANLSGGGASGESRPQRIGVSGQDDILVREYRDGDDVRRVHWRSTARRGELMVRREEQAWDPSFTLILDSRAQCHGGVGNESSFEYAVAAATSVALHFLDDGFHVDLFDATGPMLVRDADTTTQTGRQHILHAFTDAQPVQQRLLSENLQHSVLGQKGQMVVAVTGRLTPADAEMLIRSRKNRAQGLAIVYDVDSFVPRAERADDETREAHEQAVKMLKSHLWRVAEPTRTTSLQQMWSDLSRIGEMV